MLAQIHQMYASVVCLLVFHLHLKKNVHEKLTTKKTEISEDLGGPAFYTKTNFGLR